MNNIVYVAADEEMGYIILGAKGHAGFTSTGALNCSIAQNYHNHYRIAEGKKASDYYDITEEYIVAKIKYTIVNRRRSSGNKEYFRENVEEGLLEIFAGEVDFHTLKVELQD